MFDLDLESPLKPGAVLKNHNLLEDLLGTSKAEQERLLKENLEKRKERKANGDLISHGDKIL